MTAQHSELRVIDSHTGGEPTRLVIDGFPDLGAGNMAERRDRFARDYDDWRKAIILEPRGNDVRAGITAGHRRGHLLQQQRFSEHVRSRDDRACRLAGLAWPHSTRQTSD